MARWLRMGSIFVLTWSSVVSSSLAAAEALPPATRWVPGDAVLVVEVERPGAVLDLVLGPRVSGLVTALPAYQARAARPDFQQLLLVVHALEAQLGTDWKSGLHRLLDGGVNLAVMPGGGNLVVVDAKDEVWLQRLHEVLIQGARDDAARHGRPDPVACREVGGVTVWTFDGVEAHALLGRRLLLANRADVLRAALELRSHPDRPNLGTRPEYQAARRASGR